jgi:Asp/Glu/hydantoin racemase
MALRLWYQSMSDVAQYPEYREAIGKHARAVLDPSTEIEINGVRPGTYGGLPPVEVLKYPYAYQVLLEQVIGNCISAEAKGFSAIVLGSYSEPFLREIRCAVDIPVVSLAESTLLVACSVSAKAGLVTVNEDIRWMAERLITKHHLEARVAGVWVLEPAVNEHELVAAFADPKAVMDNFTAAARIAIANRADVILPAEGVLNELLVANQLREIDGVSVMDCVGVNLLYAEMMANLRIRTGLAVGRRWEYPMADPGVRELLRQHAATVPLSAASIPA